MNSLTLRTLLEDCRSLIGKRFNRAQAPGNWELRFELDEKQMVLSLHPEHNTLYISPEPLELTRETALTKSLEQHLKGSTLDQIEQSGLDRQAVWKFRGRDRLGDPVFHQLVFEMTGKGANLVLVQGEKLWSGRVLARYKDDRSRRNPRPLNPGASFRPRSSTKKDITRDELSELVERLKTIPKEDFTPKEVAKAWEGVDIYLAEVLWQPAPVTGDPTPEMLAERWQVAHRNLQPGHDQYQPTAVLGNLGKAAALVFHPLKETLERDDLEAHTFPTLQETLRSAYSHFLRGHRAGQNTSLVHAVRRIVKRNEKAIAALGREAGTDRSADSLRRQGEAILAAAHTLEKGMKSAELPDPSTGDMLEIRLNPAKTPSENAELYFKKARKADRAGDKIGDRSSELHERMRGLQDLSKRLDAFMGREPDDEWLQDAKTLQVPLPKEHAERVQGDQPEDGLSSTLRPRRYDLGKGWEVLVGKNNRSNHIVSFEISRPHDIWMHASGCPGSHLLLRHDEKGKEPPRDVLLTAAGIAAFFSKARNSTKVPVTVAEKRHVRRPRKAPIGQALVGEHKTIIVTPINPDRK